MSDSNIFDRNGLMQSMQTLTSMNSSSHSDSLQRFGAVGRLIGTIISMFA